MKLDIDLEFDADFMNFISHLKVVYGEDFAKLNGFSNNNLNFTSFIDNFVDSQTVADATIDGNANSSNKDIKTLMSDMIKPHTKLIAYNKIFYEMKKKYGLKKAQEWLENEWNGTFYLHNAPTSTYIPYCFAYDLDEIAEKGLFFIEKFKPSAAKHLTTFNDHVLEFISWASNRSSGAVGLPSYLVYSFYFWKKDVENNFYLKDPEYYRRQYFQKFIYDLNQPYLRITECAFTNITLMDRHYLAGLFGERQFPDGSYVIDYIDEIIEHQKVFMEVVSEIRREQYMTFPVITFSLLFQNGKFQDEDFARFCNKHNLEWYDANFFVGNDVSILSNCCRLLSDTTKLSGFINSIGGTSLKIGSVQVNTLNLRRIALTTKTKEEYLQVLEQKITLSMQVLDVLRNIIKRNIEKGLLPNYTHKLIEMERQYNTIGLTAMYEVIREFGLIEHDEFGNEFYSEEGLEFASAILAKVNELKDNFTDEYSINVEFVPGESANVVVCKKDSALFGNKYNDFIYSNQWIPLMSKTTLDEKVKLGAKLDKECGGGQISHINLQGRFADEEQSWQLLNSIADRGVIYFAYNVKTYTCSEGHGFYEMSCPQCGRDRDQEWSRIVGFLVGQKSYSKERKQEFSQRKWFELK